MKQILPLLFLLYFVVSPCFVFASPQFSITSIPISVTSGEEFQIVFIVSGLEISQRYYMKALGGEGFTEVDTWNSSWLQQNASWVSMPDFSTDSDGNATTTLKARFETDTASGSKELKIRIQKALNGTNIDSPIVNVTVASPPDPSVSVEPTSTIEPSPTPSTTSTVEPTPSKSIYSINKPKDQNGNYLYGVKIFVDNLDVHHEDDEVMEFCPSCYCDNNRTVLCDFGIHSIVLAKTNYSSWSETRNIAEGGSYTVSPVLAKITTPTPTPSQTTTSTPTNTPTNSPSPTRTPIPSLSVIAPRSTSGGRNEVTRPSSNSSDTFISSASSVLGDSTPSSSLHLSASGRRNEADEAVPATRSSGATKNPNIYKYLFIIGVLSATGSGGLLYFRHRNG